ncbi:MAG TPA: ATP-binding protein [Bryobacteraceae bacterium]|nr:ATP-binding protein [Bryobacteraceae bacterium]
MKTPLHSLLIRTEEDVVSARRLAREAAHLLEFDGNDQTRIATAVSEIARNAFRYGGGGQAEYMYDAPQSFYTIRISDRGPGIADLKKILNGSYVSSTGMGVGIVGARRLMDDFQIQSEPGKGTVVVLSRRLPHKTDRFTAQRLSRISAQLSESAPRGAMDELQRENQELLRLLDELRGRQDELARLNGELEDTNRGVVALYAELDEKAERLRRADQMKSRFLSHMSHEFRTPLTSILALSRLLLDRTDGELAAEQQKQVTFIRRSAESLLEMVNDLLDLARVEAGKSVVRPARFSLGNLFKALRGVLRPLQVSPAVELIFEDPGGFPEFHTDEAKVAQILRNFVSNALKFTERGEVRVSAVPAADGKRAVFAVSDTGIGIHREHLDVIFQEFAQIETPLHGKYKGTGLGLPLSKGLAELLGGRVWVESTPGRGSTFFAEIPLSYSGTDAQQAAEAGCEYLLIDDEEVSRYLIRQCLGSARIAEASEGSAGIEMARQQHPRAILLDLRMPGMDGFEVLSQLKADPATHDTPVVIMTAKALSPEERHRLNQQADAVFSKEVLSQPDAGQRIRAAVLASQSTRPAGTNLSRM